METSNDSISDNNAGILLQNTRKTSKIHDYFTLDATEDNFICNTCGDKFVKQDSSSTGNIRNHLKRAHKDEFNQLSSEPRHFKKRKPENTEAPVPISKEVFQDKLVNLIVNKNLPFSFVEDPDFQDLLNYITKDENVSKLPGRTSMTNKISKAYQEKKETIKAAILDSQSKVSIVVDGWTSSNQIGFQGVICRYVSKNWELVTVPLDLTELSGPHSGENMAAALVNVLEDFNLLDKVHSVTTDNAASMDVFSNCLATELTCRGFFFDVFHQRVRCLAHVINLCAQGMIDFSCAFVPIAKLRDGIRAIRSTPQRRGAYYRQFPPGPGQKKANLPILDCKTRWNSTFYMITRALSVKKELNLALKSNSDLSLYVLTSSEWNQLLDLKRILMPLEEATQMVSVQRTPNISEATMIYQFLFVHLDRLIRGEPEEMESSPTENSTLTLNDSEQSSLTNVSQELSNSDSSDSQEPSNDSWIKNAAKCGKLKLQKYYPDSGGKAVALGMILHPSYKFKWFRVNKWRSGWINEYKTYFEEEWEKYRAVTELEECNVGQKPKDLFGKMYRNQMKASLSKRDIDKYISAAVVDKDEVEKVGLLKWWQARVFECPIVSKMAKDYLSASGSGVPVESFFATGTDILTSNRQRLSGEHIKQLMCLKKWNQSAL